MYRGDDLLAAKAKSDDFRTFLQYFLTHPEYKAVFYYRLYTRLYTEGGALKKALSKFLWLRNVKLGCYASPKSEIGTALSLPHPVGVVIGDGVVIGNNCTIYQNVTIGQNKSDYYPIIGNNVTIYAGAVLIGAIRVGDNVIIGANAVVNKDISDNDIVAGIPARSIKK